MKGKEEVSERMLNEMEASQLSFIEFKALVKRKLNELTQNYQNYRETTVNSANYINMKKEIENIHKSKQKIKNTIS